ncbi:hypothetical protein CO724_17160 [Ectopseudomonas mendocina]|nr:hypothetical protein CO724_17160 [Pseudomonas mendocina]
MARHSLSGHAIHARRRLCLRLIRNPAHFGLSSAVHHHGLWAKVWQRLAHGLSIESSLGCRRLRLWHPSSRDHLASDRQLTTRRLSVHAGSTAWLASLAPWYRTLLAVHVASRPSLADLASGICVQHLLRCRQRQTIRRRQLRGSAGDNASSRIWSRYRRRHRVFGRRRRLNHARARHVPRRLSSALPKGKQALQHGIRDVPFTSGCQFAKILADTLANSLHAQQRATSRNSAPEPISCLARIFLRHPHGSSNFRVCSGSNHSGFAGHVNATIHQRLAGSSLQRSAAGTLQGTGHFPADTQRERVHTSDHTAFDRPFAPGLRQFFLGHLAIIGRSHGLVAGFKSSVPKEHAGQAADHTADGTARGRTDTRHNRADTSTNGRATFQASPATAEHCRSIRQLLEHGQPSAGRVIDDGTDALANGRQQARIFAKSRGAVCIVSLELLKTRIARGLRLLGSTIGDALRVAGVSIDSGGDRAASALGALDNSVDDAAGFRLLRFRAVLTPRLSTRTAALRVIVPRPSHYHLQTAAPCGTVQRTLCHWPA